MKLLKMKKDKNTKEEGKDCVVMNKSSKDVEIVSKKKKLKLSNGISENGHLNPENGHATPENGHANPALETKSTKKSSKKLRVSEEIVENVIPREKKRKSAPENNDEENGIVSESVTEPAKKKKKSNKKKDEQIDEENGEHSEPSGKIENGKPSIAPESFENFNISESIIKSLQAKGINSLFPVQMKSFNHVYNGSDVIVQSRTGSGKTLSFAIPLVEKLHQQIISKLNYGRPPQVLVLTPTRELSKQVADSFSDITSRLTVLCVYGGTQIGLQERSLRNGIDIMVGTPGRIQDLINRGSLDLSQLKHVVLDEVDRMLDMGFADSVDEILQNRYVEGDHSNNPQTLMFSATMPAWVEKISKKYLSPKTECIDLVGKDDMKTSKTVQHLAIRCSYFDRAATISSILQVYSGSQGRAMIFCETKRDADELALSKEIKQETQVIHGDIPQDKREMVLKGFREGRYRCLIATDVAARGLDIPEVDLVIQCSPPKDVESYIHRSGRTGRAGRTGTCILFFKQYEENELRFVEQKAKIKIKIIGPPTPADIIKASAEDAAKTLDIVSPATAAHFKDWAEKLVSERGAVESLSAALAVISGNSEIKPRSLLSAREDFTTYLFRSNVEMRQLGYVWRALERCITPELKEKISRMRFCADRKGCVFDIPSEEEAAFESLWKDGNCDTLVKAAELPELEPQFDGRNNQRNNYSSYNNGGGGLFGRGNGSYGRGGRRRGFSRGR